MLLEPGHESGVVGQFGVRKVAAVLGVPFRGDEQVAQAAGVLPDLVGARVDQHEAVLGGLDDGLTGDREGAELALARRTGGDVVGVPGSVDRAAPRNGQVCSRPSCLAFVRGSAGVAAAHATLPGPGEGAKNERPVL